MSIWKELENCFSRLEKNMTKDSLNEFQSCLYEDLYRYHFGLGTWIRNCLLKNGSHLYLILAKGGIQNKDDMSALIIRLYYIYIHVKK